MILPFTLGVKKGEIFRILLPPAYMSFVEKTKTFLFEVITDSIMSLKTSRQNTKKFAGIYRF
jgi:hypothetical protein